MSKSTNYREQPILNQLLLFIDKGKIRKIAMQNQSDRYVKKFSTYNHVVVMQFLTFENYHSIRQVKRKINFIPVLPDNNASLWKIFSINSPLVENIFYFYRLTL